jgi:aryl-alcohol dehydrogenase-like predicted oxidoreductase
MTLIDGRGIAGIGLGTAPLAFRDGTDAEAVATVRAALDAGVRIIDTALAYTRHGVESYAEHIVASALRGATGERPLVATKGGHWRDGDRFPVDGRPTTLRVLACARRGIAYLAYAPLAAPSGRPLEAALAVAGRHDASIQRVMLAWLREQAPSIVPLVGASRPASIRDSADPLHLTGRDLAELNAARTPGPGVR